MPGVGFKIALLLSQFGFDEVRGISVDTHVHRVSNRLGWVRTLDPNKTMKALESFLPKKFWAGINLLLVGMGQMICFPVKPNCQDCLANQLCETGIRNLKSKSGISSLAKQRRKIQ